MSSGSRSDVSPLLHELGGVYRDPSRLINDGNKLIRSNEGKALKAKVSSITLNDGTSHGSVLTFAGTIGMRYKGFTYNVPIEIFIPPGYPIRPPLCFVRPIEGMALKENHRNVGPDGMVYMPFLNQWGPHTSTLREMIVVMGLIFGEDPPVFKKPLTAHVPYVSQPHITSHTPYVTAQPPNYDEIQAREIENEKREREEAEALARVLAESERAAELEDEIRTTSEIRDTLSKKLVISLKNFNGEVRGKISSSLKEHATLDGRKKVISEEIKNLKDKVEIFNTQIRHVDDQTEKITDFIEKQELKGETPVDNLAIPGDLSSKQMLQLSAKNAAIGDCLYYIDKALMNGHIELVVHLKEVRKLAKKQFFARAHLVKIAKMQV
eukprot:CAMPEP_0194358718 /NCGR_PEP_ID=MMETSP0174-20130528/5885_1 /TAXON_ID=216777 /ORGANISM="Proboscia alata, Strain PI-D3" /LENGTH=379 /DNA_ID=CAMNT_0039129169 /DNA_START=35 /DNA_END=1174 /DNA_ORIENTATION=-